MSSVRTIITYAGRLLWSIRDESRSYCARACSVNFNSTDRSVWWITVRPSTVNYDETDIAERYDAGRHIPDRAMRVWFDAIKSRISPNEIRQILDVGCGTGRFSTRLAQEFNADVIGVDPAETMLAKARTNTTDPRVTFRVGVAESLPVSAESVCLAYLSMVYHHLCDLRHAFLEFNRILRDGGFLCIRNSTLGLLDKVPYLKYFPSALSYNRTRLPRNATLSTLGSEVAFLW